MRPWLKVSTLMAGVGLGGCGGGMLGGPSPTAGGAGAAGAGTITGTGGSTIGANCGAISMSTMKVSTDLLLVLDRSGSMNSDLDGNDCGGDCGGTSRWAQLTSALGDVLAATPTDVNWGLKVFADSNSSCSVGNGVQVPVGPSNAGPVLAAIAGWTSASGGVLSGSESPTRMAENAAATYLSALSDRNPRYILLATDGLPNCAPGGAMATDDSAGAIAAVQAARDLGIPTFVAGVAAPGSTADATLNALANAGGMPRPGTPSYYSTGAELTDLFASVVTTLSSCTFALPVPPNGNTSAEWIHVFVDGVQLPQDTSHTSGWDYTDASHAGIELYGATCAALKTGEIRTVTVTFLCVGLG